MTCASDHRESVADVEFTNERRTESGGADAKFRFCAGEMEIGRAKVRIGSETKALHRAMFDFEKRGNIWIVPIRQQQTVARNEIDQALRSEERRVGKECRSRLER